MDKFLIRARLIRYDQHGKHLTISLHDLWKRYTTRYDTEQEAERWLDKYYPNQWVKAPYALSSYTKYMDKNKLGLILVQIVPSSVPKEVLSAYDRMKWLC